MPPDLPTLDRRFAAVIFDLDGVLVDSEGWWNDVRFAFAARHGRDWTHDDQAAVMGANSHEWAVIMRDRLRLDGLTPDEIETEVVDGVVGLYETRPSPVIDHAPGEVRRIAEGRPVAIASSSHPRVIAAALASLGIEDVMQAVVSSDDVATGKPAPDVYLAAAERLGVEPARCLVVEDSLNGVKAGRAAGMTVVLVPNPTVPPAGNARELADHVITSLEQLDPDALEPAARD
jgi:beta-phosphoglucomutase-like phosphatase (HAD superfamily)